MNIPNLPTDNLYKFIAIFGLILIIATMVLMSFQFKIIESDFSEIRAKESLHKDYTKGKEDSLLVVLHSPIKKYDAEDSLFLAAENLKTNYERFKFKILEDLVFLTGFVGIFLTFSGFYLWFINYQLYQDLIILKQSGYEIKDWNLEKRKIKNRMDTIALVFMSCLLILVLYFIYRGF